MLFDFVRKGMGCDGWDGEGDRLREGRVWCERRV